MDSAASSHELVDVSQTASSGIAENSEQPPPNATSDDGTNILPIYGIAENAAHETDASFTDGAPGHSQQIRQGAAESANTHGRTNSDDGLYTTLLGDDDRKV